MPKYYKALSKKKLPLKELILWHDICDFYDYDGLFNGFGIIPNIMVTITISSFCSETLLKLTLYIVTLETVKAMKVFCPNIISLDIVIYLKQFLDTIIP